MEFTITQIASCEARFQVSTLPQHIMHLFVRALVCSVLVVHVAVADPPSFDGTRFSTVGRNTDGNGLPSGLEGAVGKFGVPAELASHVFLSDP